VVVVQNALLPLLQRDFWAYASLILDAQAKRKLEDACRAAGAPAPPRFASAGPDQPGVAKLLEVAFAERGHDFVRHAGYFCGANAGRAAEANVRSPNDGANRLVEEFSVEASSLNFEITQNSPSRCTVSIISVRPLGPALIAYAEGFVKGASMRLNEGAAPTIRERSAAGGKVWTATFDWGTRTQGRGAKGVGRTRRK
jgi:hypothetical protein